MNSNADLQKAIEDTLTQIGRENARVMAAQLVSLVEQIRNGGPSKVTLVWEEPDTPKEIHKLIYADKERHDILMENHGYYYAVLLPMNRTEFPAFFEGDGGKSVMRIDLPQNKLIVYY